VLGELCPHAADRPTGENLWQGGLAGIADWQPAGEHARPHGAVRRDREDIGGAAGEPPMNCTIPTPRSAASAMTRRQSATIIDPCEPTGPEAA
jgi:hypothetical protein